MSDQIHDNFELNYTLRKYKHQKILKNLEKARTEFTYKYNLFSMKINK